jgi:hypothetical protein
MNKTRIFRWLKNDEICEYRFTKNKCDGFFINNIIRNTPRNYKGKKLTQIWEENLLIAGFKEMI